MKCYSLFLVAAILVGCATTPEQQLANQQRRDAEREQRQQRELAEQKRRHQEEVERDRQKYAHLNNNEINIRIVTLNQEISAGYYGYGLALVIAKGIYDGKVKEREALMMELARRGETGSASGGRAAAVDPNLPKGTGTGFFITDDGYFVTCAHVVKGSTRIVLKVKATEYPATVIRTDAANDIAVLKAEGTFRAIPQTSSKDVRLGQAVFTIGFPIPTLQGVEPKLTRGDISSLAGIQDDPRYFQVSVPTQPGNSGGPIVDERGNAVGILSSKLRDSVAIRTTGSIAQNVNYAIKSSLLATVLESIPEVAPKMKLPQTGSDRKFEDVVNETQQSVALVVAY